MVNIDETHSKIKQIYFEENSGKIFLFDNHNNTYECNIYGDKCVKFLPGITGFANFSERKQQFEETLPQMNFNYDTKLYRPQQSNIIF